MYFFLFFLQDKKQLYRSVVWKTRPCATEILDTLRGNDYRTSYLSISNSEELQFDKSIDCSHTWQLAGHAVKVFTIHTTQRQHYVQHDDALTTAGLAVTARSGHCQKHKPDEGWPTAVVVVVASVQSWWYQTIATTAPRGGTYTFDSSLPLPHQLFRDTTTNCTISRVYVLRRRRVEPHPPLRNIILPPRRSPLIRSA